MKLSEAYSTLGIPETATQDEAKKKYRELSKTLHPDVNKEPDAEDKFKKINEAYQCIKSGKGTDREDNYDNNVNINDFIRDFGGFNPFQNHFNQQRVRQVRNIILHVNLSFEESVLGCKRDVKFSRKAKCPECNGEGRVRVHNGCNDCNGTGMKTSRQGNMIFNQTCNKCGGRTQVKTCNNCQSTGTLDSEVSIQVNIPGGVQSGNVLRLGGMGDFAGNFMGNEQFSDAHLHVHVSPEENMMLQDNDVVSKIEISLLEALKGCKKSVKTVLGNKDITIKPKSRNSEEVSLPNHGVNKRGSHRFILDVKYPDDVSNLIKLLKTN